MLQLHRPTFQKVIIWAVILLLLNTYVNAQTKFELTKKLNCRKFIFAPRCRGVAAKRGYPTLNALTTDERNYPNGNRDSTVREILLNYILSRIEANVDNDVNTDSAEDLSSYR